MVFICEAEEAMLSNNTLHSHNMPWESLYRE